jgi:hypothetical protein
LVEYLGQFPGRTATPVTAFGTPVPKGERTAWYPRHDTYWLWGSERVKSQVRRVLRADSGGRSYQML